MLGVFWKFARIGERLSPYVSICCIVMAVFLILKGSDELGFDVAAVNLGSGIGIFKGIDGV
jgi:hypothetical protein